MIAKRNAKSTGATMANSMAAEPASTPRHPPKTLRKDLLHTQGFCAGFGKRHEHAADGRRGGDRHVGGGGLAVGTAATGQHDCSVGALVGLARGHGVTR